MTCSARAGGSATLLLMLLVFFLGGPGHEVVHHGDEHGGSCALCLVSGAEPPDAPRLARATWTVVRRVEAGPQAPELAVAWSSELVRGPPRGRAPRPAPLD